MAELMDGEEKIGHVAGRLGGGIELQLEGDENKELSLYASPKSIWNAYCKAINRENLKVNED
jgi:hypothetical protein